MSIIKLKKKASSLAEVMIVLGIISTAMVASISIMVNSLIRIRVNDIEDSANTILIQALEIAKSPTQLRVNADLSTIPYDSSVFLALGDNDRLQIQRGHSVQGNLINPDCNTSSVYNVNDLLPEDVSASSQICIQLEVTRRRGINDNDVYEITARSKYVVPGGDIRSNVITGFRYSEI